MCCKQKEIDGDSCFFLLWGVSATNIWSSFWIFDIELIEFCFIGVAGFLISDVFEILGYHCCEATLDWCFDFCAVGSLRYSFSAYCTVSWQLLALDLQRTALWAVAVVFVFTGGSLRRPNRIRDWPETCGRMAVLFCLVCMRAHVCLCWLPNQHCSLYWLMDDPIWAVQMRRGSRCCRLSLGRPLRATISRTQSNY